MGGGAQVWIGDGKKSRFVKTPGTAFKQNDICKMTVDLKKGEIVWYINEQENMHLPHRMIKDPNYKWAIYLLMLNNEDEVQLLLDD